MTATRTAAAATLAVALGATACSSGNQRPPTVITIAPGPAATAPRPAPTAAEPTTPPRPARDAARESAAAVARRLGDSGDPEGTPVEFAIRYLSALRAGRWVDAVKEMASVERAHVRLKENAEAVGRDVLANAAGGRRALPHCTSGSMVGRDAVVIGCGDVRVVVHVETWRTFRGVKVHEVFVPSDHYGHPHTHAYTSLLW